MKKSRFTEEQIVAILREADKATRNAEVLQQFAKLDYEPVGSTPDEQLRNFADTMKFFFNAAKSANYQPQ